ncbi:hypothetical protein SAMD00019534_019120, partial [Acytostelium subglobosum LB1]|uniref:hypothetical protein n=1 Tax=Acytostelium subglobosum LB1 TaxID=1410327 RepID=UPI000644D293
MSGTTSKYILLISFIICLLFITPTLSQSKSVDEHHFFGTFSTIPLATVQENSIQGNFSLKLSYVNSTIVLYYYLDLINVNGEYVEQSTIRLEGPAKPGTSSTNLRTLLSFSNATRTPNEFHGTGHNLVAPFSQQYIAFNSIVPHLLDKAAAEQLYIVFQPLSSSVPVTRSQLIYTQSTTNGGQVDTGGNNGNPGSSHDSSNEDLSPNSAHRLSSIVGKPFILLFFIMFIFTFI